MALKIVEEGKTVVIRLSYKDIDRRAIIPSALRWRIDDLDSSIQIHDWASVSVPAASNDITIDDTYNHLYVSTKLTETRVVTTEATFSDGTMIPKEIRYQILNLKFYTPA